MALKFKLDKAAFEKLDEAQQALYKESGDMYVLDVDGVDEGDTAALKSKNEQLLAEAKAAKQKADEAEEKARQASEDAAAKSGDVEALKASWQSKLDKQKADADAEIASLSGSINSMTVKSEARRIAAEIAVDQESAAVLIPHIETRLKAERGESGDFRTVVYDASGKPSAASLDDLKTEFSDNPAFARVIAGSKANGGGAGAGDQGGGAAKKTVTREQFEGMDHAARQIHVKEGGTITD